jgi:hypothetical protein
MAAQYSLAQVVNTLFRLKHQWPIIDDESKKAAFFIINRYLCKKYPINAHFLNQKGFDEAVALEIWFLHQRETNMTPSWFWQKPELKKFSKMEYDLLDEQILGNFKSEIQEDLDYYNQMLDGPVTEKVKKSKK